MRDRIRVAVYVGPVEGERVLCFDHTDFPAAGRQIPAGGVKPGETLEAAAAREVWEETGIRIGRPRSLGVQIREDTATDTRKVTVFLAAIDLNLAEWSVDPSSGHIQVATRGSN